jgi:phospholipid/cholesterol/gamma-HCH transport system permease protein
LPAAFRLASQRRFIAIPPSMAASLDPVVEQPMGLDVAGEFHSSPSMFTQLNEEIDALQTLGLKPIDFLVLPRMLALMIMMPLLALYANGLGILGGLVVGTAVLGIAPELYWDQTLQSVHVGDFAVGLVKAVVVGILVAIAGCMRGLQSGRSASAVGQAATSAVVTGIVMIVVSEAVFAVIFEALGI